MGEKKKGTLVLASRLATTSEGATHTSTASFVELFFELE